jgi:hypothetical protein
LRPIVLQIIESAHDLALSQSHPEQTVRWRDRRKWKPPLGPSVRQIIESAHDLAAPESVLA